MAIPCLQNRSINRAHLFSGCAITLKWIIFSHLRQIEKRAPSFMIKHVVTTGPRQRSRRQREQQERGGRQNRREKSRRY